MAFPGFPKAIKTPRDLHVSQTLVDFFSQFAASGDPGWEAYSAETGRQVMVIGREGTTEVRDYPQEELRLCEFVSQIHDEVSPTQLSEESVEEVHSRTADARPGIGPSSRRGCC